MRIGPSGQSGLSGMAVGDGTASTGPGLWCGRRRTRPLPRRADEKPRPELANRLEREVRARWQPQIRARAKEAAASTSGIMIDVQARFGYTAAPGSTDQARVRHLTLALSPRHAARLLQAQEAGVDEDELRQVAAEALGEVCFRDNGRRAHGLEVDLKDIVDLQFEL